MLKVTLFMKPIHNTRVNSTHNQKGFYINPYDLFVLKTICQIKRQTEITVAVISMGPLSALDALNRCIYYGADNGYLISDKKLSSSDTLKTGQVLSFAAKKCGLCDYYFFGQKSTDGETGQIGIIFATIMKLPIVLDVTHILKINEGSICVQNKYGENILAPLHSVIVMNKQDTNDYLSFYNLQKKVNPPVVFSLDDIGYYSSTNDIKTTVMQIENRLKIRAYVSLSKEEFIVSICHLTRG